MMMCSSVHAILRVLHLRTLLYEHNFVAWDSFRPKKSSSGDWSGPVSDPKDQQQS